MSERLYYWDSYQREFEGEIVELVQSNGRFAAILNQTLFYPTSGGQPHDTGFLGNTAVSEVTIRETDGAVLHWLGGEMSDTWQTAVTVTGRIHWQRRFDHMQQHSGQHILSQAFIRLADAQTVSFHLSAESVTIDLDTEQLSPSQITAAEALANQIVWENRPIRVQEVSLEEAQQLKLRKIPDTAQEKLRLIDIENFDLTACGGTHVASTGAVGLIKIVKQERIRGLVRVVFCCGSRALADYSQKHDVLQEIGAHLTTSFAEFPQAIQSLQESLKQANRAFKQQSESLLALEAAHLLASGRQFGPITLIAQAFSDKDAGQLRILANHLTQHAGVVVLLGVGGDKSYLLFSRAADVPGNMNTLLQEALLQLGGRGGGTAVTAQGGGPAASETQIRSILDQILTSFKNQLP